MGTKEEIVTFIAEFKGLQMEEIVDSMPLGLSSLAAQRFRTALKRKHRIDIPEKDFKSITVQDVLEHADDGTLDRASSLPLIPISASPPDQLSMNIGIGIDIEHVAEFRTTKDPAAEQLFLDTFTPAEFGYCLLQADPAQHFTARFCAKEALRKCSPEFASLAFIDIQVLKRPDGTPYYHIPRLNMELTHVALSLSHTPDIAIAVAAKRM